MAAAAVSVVIWRYAIGWSLSIWNARMMQLIIFLGRTLGRLVRGARRRLVSTFRCPEVGLDFFQVSRGWIRMFAFRCPEVGLDFSLLGVQGLDHTLSLLSLWLRLRCPW